MYHYRQALVRMRQGESDRQIHATGLMGRRTLGALRKQADERGWLDPARSLPPDHELAAVLQRPKPTHTHALSSLEPYRSLVEQWCSEGIDGTTIHAALKRRHGYTGSYSSVRRFLQSLAKTTPRVTSVLEFAPGEAAQVDFGKGPEIVDVHTGEAFKRDRDIRRILLKSISYSAHLLARCQRGARSEKPIKY